MNKLTLIIHREFIAKVRNKSFIVMTFLSPLIMVGMGALIYFLMQKNDEKVKKIVYVDHSELFSKEDFKDTKTIHYKDYTVLGIEETKKKVEAGNYYGALFIPKQDSIELLAKSIEFYSKDYPGMSLMNSIENKIKEHSKAPHLRLLQKIIAEEVTTLVHGKEAYLKALEVSQILFGKSTDDALQKLDTQTFLEIFAGVPQAKIKRSLLDDGIDIVTVLTNETGFFNSKGEARRAINQNAISVNQSKVTLDYFIGIEDLIANQYILLQRGKKNYFVIKVNY